MSIPTARPVIILGMARSGTSLIGHLLHRWGAYGGDTQELTQGDSNNPNGYFENRRMQRFMLTHLGLDFWHPSYPERLRTRARDPERRRQALELTASMADRSPAWFWKEPALCVTLPFWKEIWGDAAYVIPVRDPYDSATSNNKLSIPQELRSEVSVVFASLLEWQHYMLSTLAEMASSPRKIFVSYEQLVASPREQCLRLSRFLDEHCGDGRPDRLERMVQAVDPKLHRNRSGVLFSDRPEATAEQRVLYRHLLRRIEDPDLPFDAAEYPIYPGWREYLGNIRFFRKVFIQLNPQLKGR